MANKPSSLSPDIVKKGDAAPALDAKTRAHSRNAPIPIHDESRDIVCRTPLRLSAEVGRTQLPLKNILQLAQGSVVELDQGPEEPLRVYVNDELFGYGMPMLTAEDRYAIEIIRFFSRIPR